MTTAVLTNDTIAQNISINLKKLMSIYDIPSVSTLAKELNINRMTLKRLLYGLTKKPKDKVLMPIATYFSLTLEQIKGFVPIYWENIGVLDFHTGTRVPIYQWGLEDGTFVPEMVGGVPLSIVADTKVSKNSYGFIIKDPSAGLVFIEGTYVIFDSDLDPWNEAYVLVLLEGHDKAALRKLLIDMDDKYIKSPNPIIQGSIRKLEEGDKILAVLVQTKKNFKRA